MKHNPDERFPIVEEDGTVIGSATRAECHGGSMLLHPVVHLHVVTKDGSVFLQKRSMTKDIQPYPIFPAEYLCGVHLHEGKRSNAGFSAQASEY